MASKTTTSAPPPDEPCPRCGYCAHCGRGNPGVQWVPVHPAYPYPVSPFGGYQIWCGTNTNSYQYTMTLNAS